MTDHPVPSGAGFPGAILLAEEIHAVYPGSDLVPDGRIDNAAVFTALRDALNDFRALGGATIVDIGGLTTGRDAELLALLAETTGVEIVAATGFGPIFTVGSHFTNNVSGGGMTADRIADVFTRELNDGLLIPPRERAASKAALVSVTQTRDEWPALPFTRGRDTIEEDTVRASARAAVATGASVVVRAAADPRAVLALLADEGLAPARTVVLGLDATAHIGSLAHDLAAEGYVVGFDHLGWGGDYADQATVVAAVLGLLQDGRDVIVGSAAIGVSQLMPTAREGDFATVLRDFVPAFRAAGGTDEQLERLLATTPREILTRTPKEA